jgi:hypothetical protein
MFYPNEKYILRMFSSSIGVLVYLTVVWFFADIRRSAGESKFWIAMIAVLVVLWPIAYFWIFRPCLRNRTRIIFGVGLTCCALLYIDVVATIEEHLFYMRTHNVSSFAGKSSYHRWPPYDHYTLYFHVNPGRVSVSDKRAKTTGP